MIEALSIPILLKAADFLFVETSKILAERRERRAKEGNVTPQTQQTNSQTASSEKVIRSYDEAIHQQVSQAAWSIAETEVTHLTELLTIHYKNYHLAKKQYAQWGNALVPPIIMNNLEHEENEIEKISEALRNTLSQLYGKEIIHQS